MLDGDQKWKKHLEANKSILKKSNFHESLFIPSKFSNLRQCLNNVTSKCKSNKIYGNR